MSTLTDALTIGAWIFGFGITFLLPSLIRWFEDYRHRDNGPGWHDHIHVLVENNEETGTTIYRARCMVPGCDWYAVEDKHEDINAAIGAHVLSTDPTRRDYDQ